MTFIAALRHNRICAAWMIDGPINGELFTIYVEQVLSPTLAKGDIVTSTILAAIKAKQPRCHPRQRRSPHLPAAIQPRPQVHRTGLRQAEAPVARRRAARSRGDLAQGR